MRSLIGNMAHDLKTVSVLCCFCVCLFLCTL
jgi:hypothetical protein